MWNIIRTWEYETVIKASEMFQPVSGDDACIHCNGKGYDIQDNNCDYCDGTGVDDGN
jgi:DnaJ-class molecular chaperone